MSLRDLINPIANPEVGLLLFVGIFLVIVVWVVTRRRKDIQRQARIPLEDDPVEPRTPVQADRQTAEQAAHAETEPAPTHTNTQEDPA